MQRLPAVALLLVLGAPLGAETIYHWTDAQGVRHFSSTPPPGQPAESRDLRVPRASDSRAERAMRDRYERAAGQRREQRREAGEDAAQMQRIAATRRDNCRAARDAIARLESTPMSRFRREDGSYQRFTPQEIERQLAEARANASANCD